MFLKKTSTLLPSQNLYPLFPSILNCTGTKSLFQSSLSPVAVRLKVSLKDIVDDILKSSSLNFDEAFDLFTSC